MTRRNGYGRRIYLLGDEPYNRIVFDSLEYHSPLEFYPYALLAYSYGKTLTVPGQRIGYLAMPPTMPLQNASNCVQAICNAIQAAAVTSSRTHCCSMPLRSGAVDGSTWSIYEKA